MFYITGKSCFILQLLREHKKYFEPSIVNLTWCYGVKENDFFKEILKIFPKTNFVRGFPEKKVSDGKLFKNTKKGQNLLILDD